MIEASNTLKEPKSAKKNVDTTSTFLNNMKLPIHRWYRFSAGFSAQWINSVLIKQKKLGRVNVLDPFAGSGTTLLEAENVGMQCMGLEAHPLIFEIASSKLSWKVDSKEFKRLGEAVLSESKTLSDELLEYPDLIAKCYPPESLEKLDKLRRCIDKLDLSLPINRLIWLTLISILRSSAPVGTASWQYILPNKKSTIIKDPYVEFSKKISIIASDIESKWLLDQGISGTIFNEDSRSSNSVPDNWADFVITSPPYANNYDYADATRLELSFLKRITGWKDLQTTIRPNLLRSCTQHVSSISKNTDEILKDPILEPIGEEIWEICKKLEKERLNHGGKKNYHTMIASYFVDIANVLHQLRLKCKENSQQCWVVGDSAPYGIYVPVEEWIGKLAISAGFNKYWFEKTRDRNVKWKNRKHRVPLKEGRLWIE